MNKISERVKSTIALCALLGSFLLASLLLFFCRLGTENASGYLAYEGAEFLIGLACLLLFFCCLVFLLLALVFVYIIKRNKGRWLKRSTVVSFICSAGVCLVSLLLDFRFSPFFYLTLGSLLLIAAIIFTAGQGDDAATGLERVKNNIAASGKTPLSVIIVCASLIALFINTVVLCFMPLFAHEVTGESVNFVQLFGEFAGFSIFSQIFCIVFLLLFLCAWLLLIKAAVKFFTGIDSFLKAARIFALYNIGMAIAVMGFSFVQLFIAKFNKGGSVFVTFINVLFAYALYMVFTVFSGGLKRTEKEKPDANRKIRKKALAPLVFAGVMTAITFIMLFVPLYSVNILGADVKVTESGWSMIAGSAEQSGFENVIALFLLTFCILSAMFFVFSVLNYVGQTDNYRYSAVLYSYINLFFQFSYFIIGLFYILVLPSFEKLFTSLIDPQTRATLGNIPNLSDYADMSSLSFIPFVAGFILLICLQSYCLNPKKAAKAQEGGETELISAAAGAPGEISLTAELKNNLGGDGTFDPCPAFSEIDSHTAEYRLDLQRRKQLAFENPTLKDLTEFVVEFAKNTAEQLSYTTDAIATFIAGLGAARLSILQGMSGTGKTSLPKVFMEAIEGNCNIVEVESSWRDKNELLGYYNEFNGVFSPKKFTQYLYKSVLNSSIPTFIVLDEMNLSRIEYYFSDFLSVMEARENHRAVTLLNKRIYPPADGERAGGYLALKGGNTVQVPLNVWFIGTANRDESTFEISDKVYDRAQTINFDRRAPKITAKRRDIKPRFIDYATLSAMFDGAKSQTTFNAESDKTILQVEKILAPYKISFGNRILKQIEDFVKVYVACFDISTPELYAMTRHRAIENIMYSKVLRKLELKIVDNKEQLAAGFEALELNQCADFIRRLEDN